MDREDTFDASKLSTREGLLGGLLEAALHDVESLTVTKERAALMMTDEAVSENEALFAAKPEIGLREFVDAQDNVGGKFAAFTATVGNPFLVTYAAFEAFKGDLDGLLLLVQLSAFDSLIDSRIGACTTTVMRVVGRNHTAELMLATSVAEQKRIADRFMLSCIERAVELALTAKPQTVQVGGTSIAVN